MKDEMILPRKFAGTLSEACTLSEECTFYEKRILESLGREHNFYSRSETQALLGGHLEARGRDRPPPPTSSVG